MPQSLRNIEREFRIFWNAPGHLFENLTNFVAAAAIGDQNQLGLKVEGLTDSLLKGLPRLVLGLLRDHRDNAIGPLRRVEKLHQCQWSEQ